MPQGTASSKVIQVQWFSLEDAGVDFGACLKAVAPLGYYGRFESNFNASTGLVEYKLKISSVAQLNIEATLGQVLVWDGKLITVYLKADALARFNIT